MTLSVKMLFEKVSACCCSVSLQPSQGLCAERVAAVPFSLAPRDKERWVPPGSGREAVFWAKHPGLSFEVSGCAMRLSTD